MLKNFKLKLFIFVRRQRQMCIRDSYSAGADCDDTFWLLYFPGRRRTVYSGIKNAKTGGVFILPC